MGLEVVLRCGSVVDYISAEVVVWHSILHDSIPLVLFQLAEVLLLHLSIVQVPVV